jgi:hypothetical protein
LLNRSLRETLPLLLIAGGILLAGAGVYLLFRRPGGAYLISYVDTLWRMRPETCGLVCDSFPSFAHTFSFSVFAALCLPHRATWIVLSCLGWFLIDACFEFAQLHDVAVQVNAHLPHWFSSVAIFDHLSSYLAHGTFDQLDLIASAVGATAAAMLLFHLHFKAVAARTRQGSQE